MESTTTQPLISNDSERPSKSKSNIKIYIIFAVCAVLSLLLGVLIGYLSFGRKPKEIQVIYGDPVSEITDPFDTYKLIDVRNESEWKEIHIESSILIPIYELQDKIEKYVQNKTFPIKVFCKSGGRGTKAKEKLLMIGYKNVANLGSIERAAKLIKDAVVIKN